MNVKVRFGRPYQVDKFRPLFSWLFLSQGAGISLCSSAQSQVVPTWAVGGRLAGPCGGLEEGEQRRVVSATGGASPERP